MLQTRTTNGPHLEEVKRGEQTATVFPARRLRAGASAGAATTVARPAGTQRQQQREHQHQQHRADRQGHHSAPLGLLVSRRCAGHATDLCPRRSKGEIQRRLSSATTRACLLHAERRLRNRGLGERAQVLALSDHRERDVEGRLAGAEPQLAKQIASGSTARNPHSVSDGTNSDALREGQRTRGWCRRIPPRAGCSAPQPRQHQRQRRRWRPVGGAASQA